MNIALPSGHVVLIDEEDFSLIKDYKWRFVGDRYAAAVKYDTGTKGKQRVIKMHRLILGLSQSDKRQVDHINGDGLDNRRCNLRVCTVHENMWNRPKNNNKKYPKGVFEIVRKRDYGIYRKFHAKIVVYGKTYSLGAYNTPEDASKAYNNKAIELQGKFANK